MTVIELIDPRERRIYTKLLTIGDGPAAFFRDACRIMRSEPSARDAIALGRACAYRGESALNDVLATFSNSPIKKNEPNGHALKIKSILDGISVPASDPISIAWLSLVGDYHNQKAPELSCTSATGGPRI